MADQDRFDQDRFDVAVVGSANLDLVATAARLPGPGETVLGRSFHEHPGGKGLNQAVAASRSGARTAFVGAVGRDAAGGRLLDVMTGEGIDATGVAVLDDVPTGRALITVDDHAENSIVVVAGANGRVAPRSVPASRVVLAQLEVPVEAVLHAFRAARAADVVTILNPAPAAELPDELLALCDVVVPNQHEVELLGGVEALRARGVDVVVVTRGGAGVEVVTRHGRFVQGPFVVTPVDTTGAGDAFCGALAARLATGSPLEAAVRWAAAAGALATTVDGAVPSLPRAADVERLVSGAAPAPPSPHG